MTSKALVFVILVGSFFASHVLSLGEKCKGKAFYKMSFQGTWKPSTSISPKALFSQGHFSAFIGCTHSPEYFMWRTGKLASPGLQALAENGNTLVLEKEIAQHINKTVWKSFKTSGPISGVGSLSGIDIEVTADYPLVSMASRLIPSPDWFFGLDGYQSLCLDGRWLDENIHSSYYITNPMDAGTQYGRSFYDKDNENIPHQNISVVVHISPNPNVRYPLHLGFEDQSRLGYFTFRKVREEVPTKHKSSAGSDLDAAPATFFLMITLSLLKAP